MRVRENTLGYNACQRSHAARAAGMLVFPDVVKAGIGNSEAEKRNIKRRLSGWKAVLESPKNRELADNDKLRIVYAVYRRGGGAFTGAHMVLAYYPAPDAEPLILDNINHEVLPGSRRPDLVPIFSFNSAGLWSAREQKGRGNATDHYRAWGDHWRRVQSGEPLRSITPDQRKAPECQALRVRSPWCN